MKISLPFPTGSLPKLVFPVTILRDRSRSSSSDSLLNVVRIVLIKGHDRSTVHNNGIVLHLRPKHFCSSLRREVNKHVKDLLSGQSVNTSKIGTGSVLISLL